MIVGVVLFSLFSPVREWCASDHHMPLLRRRFSSVAPDAALLHTLRCVRPLRLMAQLSLPVCRRTAACSPQMDFPGVHTRPHPVSVVQGEMYQPQNFLPQASKTFASAPGQLPRDVVSVPVGKVHCGEIPEDPDGRRSFAPPGNDLADPAVVTMRRQCDESDFTHC